MLPRRCGDGGDDEQEHHDGAVQREQAVVDVVGIDRSRLARPALEQFALSLDHLFVDGVAVGVDLGGHHRVAEGLALCIDLLAGVVFLRFNLGFAVCVENGCLVVVQDRHEHFRTIFVHQAPRVVGGLHLGLHLLGHVGDRFPEFGTQGHREHAAEEEHQQHGAEVHHADLLVVDGVDPGPDGLPKRLFGSVVRSVVVSHVRVTSGGHAPYRGLCVGA